MNKLKLLAVAALLSAGLSGCAGMFGKDEASENFDKETSAADVSMLEDKSRTNLGTLETAVADYMKGENRIPEKLDLLIPKYLAAIPPLDVPACGAESEKVQNYPADVMRDGEVDGSRIRGTGRWGYVHDDKRIIIFVDCLKPSDKGVPWYQVRGVY